MKGTLQGDFTRLRFDPAEPYSGVRMQQGRVQLDADWNELVDLVDRRIRTGTTDLVGASGAPAAAAAFAVAAGDHGVELGTGGHSALVGGAEGFELPAEARQGDEGLTLEAAVVVRGDGPVLGLWARLATQRTFRLAWSLSVEGERLRWRRAGGLPDLLSEPVTALCGHRRLLARGQRPGGRRAARRRRAGERQGRRRRRAGRPPGADGRHAAAADLPRVCSATCACAAPAAPCSATGASATPRRGWRASRTADRWATRPACAAARARRGACRWT